MRFRDIDTMIVDGDEVKPPSICTFPVITARTKDNLTLRFLRLEV
jgi:hypothetical protein